MNDATKPLYHYDQVGLVLRMTLDPAEILYEDGYIRISHQAVTVKGYDLFGRDKEFPLRNIQRVQIRPLNFRTGKYRVMGTGDFRTWLAADTGRAFREVVFVLHPFKGWWRAGFSVESVEKATQALKAVSVPVSHPL